MRKIILYIACSLDGFIAGKNHELDWLYPINPENDYGYKEFLAGIDTVIMGYKTYEIILGFGPYEYKDMMSYIFTRKKLPQEEKIKFINDEITSFTRNLKQQDGKDIWLMGGGEIVSLLLNENLIDEFYIFVHPIVLGDGIPLFTGINRQIDLMTSDVTKYESGLMRIALKKKGKD